MIEISFHCEDGIQIVQNYNQNEIMKNICYKVSILVQKELKNLFFLYDGKTLNYDLTAYELANSEDKISKKMNILMISHDIDEDPDSQNSDITNLIKESKLKISIIKNIINSLEIYFENKNENDINNFKEDLEKIVNNGDNIPNLFSNLYNVYNKINGKKEKPMNPPHQNKKPIKKNPIDILLTYNINKNNKESKIKILGTKFVEKNKEIFNILYKKKLYPLTDTFTYSKTDKNTLKIKLINISNKNKITNMSNMFEGCTSLYKISDHFSDLNTSEIINMENLFCECSSLKSLPDLSKWDTSNVEDMSYMFFKCSSLENLPDISKWNISKVKTIKLMFYECKSLERLPDISNWNTENIIEMGSLFCKCSSLRYLPDISKWNTNKLKIINSLFSDCSSLETLPNLSKWNTNNLTDIGCLFNSCTSLKYLTDISFWNTSNITNFNGLFADCSSLTYIPNISNWNTSKVINMSFIFYGCLYLHDLPDISRWNT